jgi:hypothetical protein
MKKLREDYIRGMLAVIHFRIFCLPFCCLEAGSKIIIFLLFYMGMKLVSLL